MAEPCAFKSVEFDNVKFTFYLLKMGMVNTSFV